MKGLVTYIASSLVDEPAAVRVRESLLASSFHTFGHLLS